MAWGVPGVDVHEVIQVHRRHLVQAMQRYTTSRPTRPSTTRGWRSSSTAATTGALALLGAVIGTGGAYLGMAAGYLDDIGALSRVPTAHLTATAVGLPAAAALAGWLLARREPPVLARRAME